MTWLTVTEYLCHKSQSDPFLTHDLSLGLQEESEDTEGVIRIRISKNNRQHNDRKKSAKGQTTIYKNNKSNTSHDDATCGAGTAYLSRVHDCNPGFSWGSCSRSLVFCAMFCRSLLVPLFLFYWSLHCLSFFNVRFLITLLVS